MKIQNQSTISYVFRNFFYLLPLTLLPALLLAFSSSTINYLTPVDLLAKMSIGGYDIVFFYNDVYCYLTLLNTSPRWWVWLLGIAAAFISLCGTFSAIERHMRLGVKQFSRALVYINDCFLPLLSYLILVFIAGELLALISSGFILLSYTIGLRAWPLFTASAVIIALQYLIFSVLIIFTICTVPARLMERYRLNIAISYSTQLVGKKFFRIYGAFLLILFISGSLLAFSKYLLSYSPKEYGEIPHMAVSTLFNIFWLMAAPAFSLRTYSSLTDSERKDLETKLFLKR